MRVATYHRVSTVDQNPTLAREELRGAAARLGELALEVEEKGSGARNDRPGLQRVMEAARKGKFDVLVVWKLDRFGRSTLDLLSNIRQLHTSGVRFVATTQGLDLKPQADAISQLLLTMLAAVAEFERTLIAERTRLGMARARRLHRPIGRRPSLSKVQVARVKAMRAKGASWSKVAEAVGTSTGTARRAAAA